LSGQTLADQKVFLQNEDHPEYGVIMKYKHGNRCNAEKNYGFNLQINCDADVKKNEYYVDPSSIAEDECHPTVIMSSPAGCPVFGMPALWRWTDANNYLIGAVLILLGGCLIQFGGKYDTASLCIIASFGNFIVVMLFLFGVVLPDLTPLYIVWICCLMSLMIGAGAGYGVYIQPKAGLVSVGLTLGTIFGSIIYIMFLSPISVEQNKSLDDNKKDVLGLMKATQKVQTEEWTQLVICMLSAGLVFAALSIIFF